MTVEEMRHAAFFLLMADGEKIRSLGRKLTELANSKESYRSPCDDCEWHICNCPAGHEWNP